MKTKTETVTYGLRVRSDLLDGVKAAANRRNVSVSTLVRWAMMQIANGELLVDVTDYSPRHSGPRFGDGQQHKPILEK